LLVAHLEARESQDRRSRIGHDVVGVEDRQAVVAAEEHLALQAQVGRIPDEFGPA
jgi:hypothetical protein